MKFIIRYFIKFGFIIFVGTIVNCLTIQFPPVSVTGTKTAAEKQIIGEQTELEKDVWMISSAKTTSNVDIQQETKEKAAKQEVQKENAYTYKGFAIMDAFAQELAELKKDGVVGENNNGLLSSLLNEESVEITLEQKEKYKPDPENRSYKILVETVKQINQARHYIIEGYILNQKRIYPEFNPDKKELLKNQKSKYQGLAVKGEFIQQDTGEWVKKK